MVHEINIDQENYIALEKQRCLMQSLTNESAVCVAYSSYKPVT